MSQLPLAIADYGDGAVMVTVRSPDESARRSLISAFRERLLSELPPGVDDVVSGLESLLVEFDPLVTTSEQVAFMLGSISRATGGPSTERQARRLDVPFVVNAQTAPDLPDVAAELGLTPDEVVARVESSTLAVSLLAAAMAPMMDGLDVPSPVRRQATPRTDVAAGSIMIAGRNAIIQPFPGPTGWRVVGRTPHTIVDITRVRPISFAPGDVFSFRRVDEATAMKLEGTFLGGGLE